MSPILQEQVCYTLYSTSSVVTQAYRGLLTPLNLTYPQFVVMMALWQKDKISVSELAVTVGLSKPNDDTVTKTVGSIGLYLSRV